MELLSDDGASDMSAKEIMRQWEQRGKNPMAAPIPLSSSPSGNLSGTASRKDQRNAPQITQAHNNPQASTGETSARPPVGTQLPSQQQLQQSQQPFGTPSIQQQQHSPNSQPQPEMGTPNPPFGQNAQHPQDSHRTGSPHRHSYRPPAFQKIGTAGAG